MVHKLFEKLIDEGYNFFTGVPDSGLKPFINDIIESDWFKNELEASWNKKHPLHLPRCYLTCGDGGKRAVIKNVE